ncbi:hypothetical protein TNCT_54961 [Trichonephila clavata]|uniref:Reverse transcriptase RNase H-like domain-containing protein n=1 Tax=Trichonephila clavata TaxID=2740835 RepID=A0A8X6KHH3_TRICU|nr:hypothetical protein TNCT_54961 [Trichonephila clavata]
MAVIYRLEHFYYYTYGRIVTVQTNHKPILGLSKKPYDIISPHLQQPWKQETIIQVGPQPRSYIIRGENRGVVRRKRFPIRQDYTENDNPRWLRTVEDLYNSDATEISRIPNDSADSQLNASPKTNRSNINQRLQVPNENYSKLCNPVVRKSSKNIVKAVHYRDN